MSPAQSRASPSIHRILISWFVAEGFRVRACLGADVLGIARARVSVFGFKFSGSKLQVQNSWFRVYGAWLRFHG